MVADDFRLLPTGPAVTVTLICGGRQVGAKSLAAATGRGEARAGRRAAGSVGTAGGLVVHAQAI